MTIMPNIFSVNVKIFQGIRNDKKPVSLVVNETKQITNIKNILRKSLIFQHTV